MAEPTTVLIVQGNRLMMEGLAVLLGEEPDLEVVGTAGSVKEAIEEVQALSPRVVLMDGELPDGDGAEAARRIRQEHPDMAVLFLTADATNDGMMRAVDAGASGYLSKAATTAELFAAIKRAAEGEFLLSNAVMSHLVARQAEVGGIQVEEDGPAGEPGAAHVPRVEDGVEVRP
jgi:DNA-binding NarL/FixJ family response regulator